jgi:hypothetical protein
MITAILWSYEMNKYDGWLEQPYSDADKRQAAFDARQTHIKDALWDSLASSPLTAEKMAGDWELLVNIEGEVIQQIAYAKAHPEECAWAMSQIIGLVDRKLELVATYQAEHTQGEDEIERARRIK